MVNTAKKTCGVLGFEPGTEKFADCTLKLYTQKVEELIAEKQSKNQVVQNQASSSQSSGSNTTTIYDPVRDSQNLMNKGQKMLGGGCTLGVDC
jgi:non-homologous end joining protein Ku